MTEAPLTRTEKAVLKAQGLISDKRSRSAFFLGLSFFIILAINSLLPVIEGDAHYTASAVETTYAEYKAMKEIDNNLRMTWLSEQRIILYKIQYAAANPDLTVNEQYHIVVPDDFEIKMYTKFFFEYPFWYISTATSLGSTVVLFYSLFNYLIVRARDRYKKYLDLLAKVDKMADTALDPTTFEPWLEVDFNQRRKIVQHKSNVKADIDKLERKTNYAIKKKLKPYFAGEIKTFYPNTNAIAVLPLPKDTAVEEFLLTLTRKEQRYLNKKEKYLSLLDLTYIKEYVLDGKVKYFKNISPMFIYNGTEGAGKTVDAYSMIKSDAKKISSDAGAKIIFMLSITVLFAILFTVTAVASIEQAPFWVVVNIITKIAPLLIQVPLAMDYSTHFMDDQIIGNLISRRSIGLLYLADMQTRGIEVKERVVN